MKMNKHQFSCTIEEQLDLPEKWGSLQSSKVRCDSKLWTVTKYYLKYAEEIYNFTVRPDDVWVVTQPKSGTTLTQEMVWLIANGDYETAKSVPLIKRFPYLEANTLINDVVINEAKEREKGDKERLADFMTVLTQQWITLEQQSDRRFIKTHLPFCFLPPALFTSGCKVIYVARNPKDVAVSHFKFLFHGADDEYFPEFFDLFINNSIAYTPYWDHVKQGWEHRGEENYCFLFYEDMVKDLRSSIEKVAAFLEKEMTEEQVIKLEKHLNIENFRSNKSVTRINTYYWFGKEDERQIVRKGGLGGWRNYFPPDLNEKANKWIKENVVDTDLKFPINFEE